jgi:hypothetical protein
MWEPPRPVTGIALPFFIGKFAVMKLIVGHPFLTLCCDAVAGAK